MYNGNKIKYNSMWVHCFVCLLMASALCVVSFETPAIAATSADTAYAQLLQEMQDLQNDDKRSAWREPWETLASRFEALYTKNPSWAGRSQALLSTARAYDLLSRYSRLRQDTLKAYAYYDAFLRAYSEYPNADQALMLSIRLAATKNDLAEAKRRTNILNHDYPDSLHLPIANHVSGIRPLPAKTLRQAETNLRTKEFLPAEVAYKRILNAMNALQNDARRSAWREPWEDLATRFETLYKANLAWPNRGAALLGAAQAYDALARRSGEAQDTNQAFSLYDRVVVNHPKQAVAEDALVKSIHFASARRDSRVALQRLAQLRALFPRSLHLAETQYLAEGINKSPDDKIAGTPNKPVKPVVVKKPVVIKKPVVVKKPPVVKKPVVVKKPPVAKKPVVVKKPPTPQKKLSAKDMQGATAHKRIVNSMNALSRDPKRSTQREPWENMAKRFQSLHDQQTAWSDRPIALLDAGRAYGALARRSGLPNDAARAYKQYDLVVKMYPKHEAAAEALFKSIELAASRKNGAETKSRALRFITMYPNNAEVLKAQTLGGISNEALKRAKEALERASEVKKRAAVQQAAIKSSQPVLQRMAWTSKKGLVTITLHYTKRINWVARSQKASVQNGKLERILLETSFVGVAKQIRPSTLVKQSLLTRVRVGHTAPKQSQLSFDFKGLKSFSVKALSSPFRIVITGSATTGLKDGVLVGVDVNPRMQEMMKLGKTKLDADFAKQLGLTVRTVAIDAGHGGKDPGAIHNGLIERTVVLDIAKKVGAILKKRGLNVVYTRQKDTWISLADRSIFAKQKNADLFVSIHMNANTNTKIHGFETYYLDFATSPAASRLAAVENAVGGRSLGALEELLADMMLGIRRTESRRLAEQIQKKTLALLKKRKYVVNDGSIRGAPFHVLMGSGTPGVLVEVGYCSNKREAKRLATNKYREYLAQGIAEGILSYAKTL